MPGQLARVGDDRAGIFLLRPPGCGRTVQGADADAVPEWGGRSQLFIGDKGMLLSNYQKHILLPDAQFAGFVPPTPTIKDRPGGDQAQSAPEAEVAELMKVRLRLVRG